MLILVTCKAMKIRYLLLCVAIGATIGTTMIITRTGPGLLPRPAHSTAQTRNQQRTQMLKDLAAALTQYRHDHHQVPVQFASSNTQICSGSGIACKQLHLVDISFLITGGDYLPTLPLDPSGGDGHGGAGFFIQRQANGNLKLTAPRAELDKTIELSFAP
jgi:hypothetical protein